MDGRLERAAGLDELAKHIKQVLDSWLEEIPFENRKRVVDITFDVIYSTGIGSFYDLKHKPHKK